MTNEQRRIDYMLKIRPDETFNKKSIQFTKSIVTKQDKLDFIRKFSKITVSSICTELGIDRSNLYRNISSSYNVDLVFREIIKKIQEIL